MGAELGGEFTLQLIALRATRLSRVLGLTQSANDLLELTLLTADRHVMPVERLTQWLLTAAVLVEAGQFGGEFVATLSAVG